MLQDDDPKHTAKTTQDLLTAKTWKVLDWPRQSVVLIYVRTGERKQ